MSQEYDGKKADIWSLGLCLYAMVTAVLPWTDGNQPELFRQICYSDIEIPNHVSPSLQALIHQMLSRNPALRPPIRRVLQAPWASAGVGGGRQQGFAKSHSCVVKRTLPPPAAAHDDPLPPFKSAARRLVVRPKKSDAATPDFAVAKPSFDLMQQVPQPGKRGTIGMVTWR
jgi:serine/threonine protein kinase